MNLIFQFKMMNFAADMTIIQRVERVLQRSLLLNAKLRNQMKIIRFFIGRVFQCFSAL